MTLKTYSVLLVTRGYFSGDVQATSEEHAIAESYCAWKEECPHPFEMDDHELIHVEVDGVQRENSSVEARS
jgi:hypothetical protein